MAKLTLTDISSGYLSTTTFNANNTLIENALENTLSRDGTSPNTMGANLDMNSNKIVNVTDGTNDQDAATVAQLNAISAGSVTALSVVGDVTITSIASGEVLKWNGSAWINNTLAEAGIAAATHTHLIADVTDFTDNSTNWDTAYGWGDHASGGYAGIADNEDVTGAWDFQNTLRISNSSVPATDYVDLAHNGTDFDTSFTNTADWNLLGGVVLKLWDSAGTDAFVLQETGSNSSIGTTANTLQISANGGANDVHITNGSGLHVRANGGLRINNSGNTDYGEWTHDGTDFLLSLTNTQHYDISGQSGGVKIGSGLYLSELSSADADIAGYGQYWVKNDTPNTPWFTDDAGSDYPVGTAAYRMYANQTDTVDGLYVNAAWYSDDGSAYTLTLEASGSTAFPVGAQFTIWNEGAGVLSINEGSGDTLYLLTGANVTDTAGGCTMAQGGYATVIRKSATVWLIMGSGITA